MVMCKCGEFVAIFDKQFVICLKCGEIHFNIEENSVIGLAGIVEKGIKGICPILECNKFTSFFYTRTQFISGQEINIEKFYTCPSCKTIQSEKNIKEYSQNYARGI